MSEITQRASQQHPCPVCGGDHACSWTDDGFHLCRRRHDHFPGWRCLGEDGNGFFFFREEGSQPRPCRPRPASARKPGSTPAPRPSARKPKRSPEEWRRLCAMMRADREKHLAQYHEAITALAESLGVSVASLEAIGCGMLRQCQENREAPCWAFPEMNGRGEVVGLLRRTDEGKKRVHLSTNGLSYALAWTPPDAGLLLGVEGPTDVAAAITAGFPAIGKPTNGPGKKTPDWLLWLADMLRDLPGGVTPILLGENDRKPDTGLWPGRDGVVMTARGLARLLGRPFRWVMPPPHVKDVRAWLLALRADGRDAKRAMTEWLTGESDREGRVAGFEEVSRFVLSDKEDPDKTNRDTDSKSPPDKPPPNPMPHLRLRTGLLHCRRNMPSHFKLGRKRFDARRACRSNTCGQCLSAKSRGRARLAAWRMAEAAQRGWVLAVAQIGGAKKEWEAGKKARDRAGATGCAFCRTQTNSVFLATAFPPDAELPVGYRQADLEDACRTLGCHVNALKPRLPPSGKKRGPELMGLRGTWKLVAGKKEAKGNGEDKCVDMGRLRVRNPGPVEAILTRRRIVYVKTGTDSGDDIEYPIWQLTWEMPSHWTDAQCQALDCEIMAATEADGDNPFRGTAVGGTWQANVDGWDEVLFDECASTSDGNAAAAAEEVREL